MTRSLVIAPQWIGDAVMSEPLLADLAARGERLAVAALPWVAPVYRAMPQVREVIELFPPTACSTAAAIVLRGCFDIAYVRPIDQGGADPLVRRHWRGLPRRRPLGLLNRQPPPEVARRWWLTGAQASRLRPMRARSCFERGAARCGERGRRRRAVALLRKAEWPARLPAAHAELARRLHANDASCPC
jgi:heptosyltransferase-2